MPEAPLRLASKELLPALLSTRRVCDGNYGYTTRLESRDKILRFWVHFGWGVGEADSGVAVTKLCEGPGWVQSQCPRVALDEPCRVDLDWIFSLGTKSIVDDPQYLFHLLAIDRVTTGRPQALPKEIEPGRPEPVVRSRTLKQAGGPKVQ